jgi:hypothetical protein
VNLPPKAGKIRSFTCPRCAKKKSVPYKYGFISGFHPPEMAPAYAGRSALGLSMPQQTAAVYATLLYENLHDKVTPENSNVLWHLLHGMRLACSICGLSRAVEFADISSSLLCAAYMNRPMDLRLQEEMIEAVKLICGESYAFFLFYCPGLNLPLIVLCVFFVVCDCSILTDTIPFVNMTYHIHQQSLASQQPKAVPLPVVPVAVPVPAPAPAIVPPPPAVPAIPPPILPAPLPPLPAMSAATVAAAAAAASIPSLSGSGSGAGAAAAAAAASSGGSGSGKSRKRAAGEGEQSSSKRLKSESSSSKSRVSSGGLGAGGGAGMARSGSSSGSSAANVMPPAPPLSASIPGIISRSTAATTTPTTTTTTPASSSSSASSSAASAAAPPPLTARAVAAAALANPSRARPRGFPRTPFTPYKCYMRDFKAKKNELAALMALEENKDKTGTCFCLCETKMCAPSLTSLLCCFAGGVAQLRK